MGEHHRRHNDEPLPERPSWGRLLPRSPAVLVFAALALTLGCSFVAQIWQGTPETLQATSTSTPTPPQVEATPTRAPEPSPDLEEPGVEGPGPSAAGEACVPEGEPGELAVSGFAGYPEAILAQLNDGAAPARVESALAEAGVASLPTAVMAGDLTGDGYRDVVVSIFDRQSTEILPEGALLLYLCEAGAYELALERSSTGLAGQAGPAGPPHLWVLEDLDADGRDELVVSAPTCGAHTCFEHVAILAWVEGEIEDLLVGETGDLPNPDVRVRDPEGDGRYELAVIGGGIGSVGAGPQRSLERVWRLEEGEWRVAEEVPGPSNYRIHALHDAEAAVRAGDDEAALVLYERVIDDDTLDDWMAPEQERALLGGYARFREVVLYTRLGQPDFAGVVLDELEEAYPAGAEGHVYLAMARLYLEGYERGGQEEGCEAARRFARDHAPVVLEPLGPAAFGYGNRTFGPEDVCALEGPQASGRGGG